MSRYGPRPGTPEWRREVQDLREGLAKLLAEQHVARIQEMSKMNDERYFDLPPLKGGRFDVPSIVASTIRDGAITTAKIYVDPASRRIIEHAAAQLRTLIDQQEEYFRARPALRLLRWLRLLPDPYMPARIWAARRAGFSEEAIRKFEE